MAESIFPHIKKSIEDFMYDEEGNIPRSKVLSIGSMLLVLGLLLGDDAFAAHRSHSSHSPHSSHNSGSNSSSHGSHVSHQSHVSHSSAANTHASHSSAISDHASHASHSNAAPSAAGLEAIKTPDSTDTLGMTSTVALVAANEIPEPTTSVKSSVK